MENGLSEQEEKVMNALILAWDLFTNKDNGEVATDDYMDFKRGIHDCQYVLMHRIVKKEYPNYWR